ncbi:MAG: hypothetical protein ACI4ED_05105 [Suilimivivens sp.]
MGSLMKILTGILGILAVIACLATIGVIGYTLSGAGGGNTQTGTEEIQIQPTEAPVPTTTPEDAAEVMEEVQRQPVSLENHVHNYVESIDQKATCYQAGRLKYTCEECGDVYYVDVPSTGHVADEEWEVIREASASQDGLRVKKCIYCDEIVAQEVIPYAGSGSAEVSAHIHDYIANIEREPTCILAGLRKYTCSCGSFYTEQIPAAGHVATDWTVVEEPTTTTLGREQRTCTVCGVVLDSRPIPVKQASPSPSASGAPTASSSAAAAATASAKTTSAPTVSPTPTATPHVHQYTSYVIKEANCTEKGIRSFVCSCGSSYAESIDIDPNKHSYTQTVVPATTSSPGYTIYRCIRCNDTYMDNYTQALGTSQN